MLTPIAQVLPVGQQTVEVHLPLESDQEESPSVDLYFPAGGTLVGFVITVTQRGADSDPALIDAGLADVLLSIRPEEVKELTRRGERGVPNEEFVTALAVDSSRRLFMRPVKPGETWTLQARWKDFLAGTPLYEDALVCVDAIVDLPNMGID